MMRFYGITDRDCLKMPFPRLLLLYGAIQVLETEEEMRDIVTTHAGDPKGRLRDLQDHLDHLRPSRSPSPRGESLDTLIKKPEAPAVFAYADASEILARRAQQQQADERRRAEWEAARRAPAANDLPGAVPAPASPG